eukprot:COSAG06_NODE_2713_length_6404_cov_8.921649_8_plen_33_part_00
MQGQETAGRVAMAAAAAAAVAVAVAAIEYKLG